MFHICTNILEASSNFMFFVFKSLYSLKKADAFLGIGTDNVIAVKCDKS